MFNRSAQIYDAVYSFKDYPAEAERVRTFVLARAPHAKTLLDVACGTGLHLATLREHYQVEGLDLDEGLLEVAAQRLPGVLLHVGDITDFDLGRTFDAVTCLFSAIAYTRTTTKLKDGIARMVHHLAPGGVLVIEPFITPARFEQGHVGARFVDESHLKIARLNTSVLVDDGHAVEMVFEYLVGANSRVERMTESHVVGLFTDEEFGEALTSNGLTFEHDPEGLMGRGLYICMHADKVDA